MSACEIGGRAYPILAGVRSETVGEFVPLVDLPLMSDYRWQEDALEHRLTHRENYEGHEDVDSVIAYLRRWLSEHGKAG